MKKSIIELFETLFQNIFQKRDWNNKNEGGKYIEKTENEWDKELKPNVKYYQGWFLVVLILLMLANVYVEIKWLFFS